MDCRANMKENIMTTHQAAAIPRYWTTELRKVLHDPPAPEYKGIFCEVVKYADHAQALARLEEAIVKWIHAGHLSIGQVSRDTGLSIEQLLDINAHIFSEQQASEEADHD